MLTPSDTKTSHIPIVVEYIEPLCTCRRRETGDYIDVSSTSYGHYEVIRDCTAFDEVFVSLRFIEAANDGPNHIARRSYELRKEGGALAGAEFVGVELEDEIPQVVELVLS
ncbi:hypothetical protein E5676_scaffold455G004440 [Cucumis melo var. makuwa]|uniref:Uncharacterized protein n=1 Tax=Cucumis melo var. makuwa TaxID=1194695 RepID=A0A5D3E5E0_CUCMM|nr:hypothetical protein E5676_scaffold455G004440 [Cucumis melo var. makuwa]